jgi:hypothetical protein
MPIRGAMRLSTGAGSFATTPTMPAPPTITAFAIDDLTLDLAQVATFTASFGGGALTGWTLNIDGTGAAEYSGTTGPVSRTHAYTVAGTYTARLIATGPGGMAQATVTGIEVAASAPPPPPPPPPPPADVRVLGNGNVIADGDSTPSSPDHTIFITAVQGAGGTERVFTVENIGGSTLTTSGLTVPTGFTVTEGLSANISAGGSDTFTVRLDDATLGAKSGDISFATNVTGKNPYNFAVSGEVVAAGGVDFQKLTVARSNTSGTQYGFFGISFEENDLTAARANKLWGRYPAGAGGTTFKIQADNHIYRDGGTQVLHCAGSAKLPSNYVAGQNFEVGYSDTLADPATPDWPTISAINPQFSVRVSIYKTTCHYWQMSGAGSDPIVGDTLAFAITPSGGSTTTYTRTYEAAAQLGSFSRQAKSGVLYDIVRDITLDPTGAARCFQDSFGKVPPAPPQGSWSSAADLWGVVTAGNGTNNGSIGFSPSGANNNGALRPRGWLYSGAPGQAMTYIWGRAPAAGVNPVDFDVTCNITRTGSSTFGFQNDPANTTQNITSGTVHKLHGPSPRVEWTASWTDVAATDAYSQHWLDGTEVRRVIRNVRFRDGSNNLHPWLDARMEVLYTKDGTIVDGSVTVENGRTQAGARDMQLDITEINFNGSNRIAGELARWADRYHVVGRKWTWTLAGRPIVRIDQTKHMKAGTLQSWVNPAQSWADPPSWGNFNDALRVRAQGADAVNDIPYPETTKLAARGGYARAQPGDPLWAAAVKFDAAGGACQEIGINTLYDYIYTVGDQFALWPQFAGLADNGYGGWPFYFRDEAVGGGDAPLNLYFKHNAGSLSSAAPHRLTFGKHREAETGTGEGHALSASPDTFSLWVGTISGGYAARYSTSASHAGAHPARTAYICEPHERFFRSVEQYSWSFLTSVYGVWSTPKTGGVAGDVDHRIYPSAANGNRTHAWCMRTAIHAASIAPHWHPRRAYLRRVATDLVRWHGEVCDQTIFGLFATQPNKNSNNPLPTRQLEGDILIGSTPGGMGIIDLFKSVYATAAVGEAVQFHAVDHSIARVALTANRGPLTLVTEGVPPENRYDFFGTNPSLVRNQVSTSNFNSSTGAIVGSVAELRAIYASKTSRNVAYTSPFGSILGKFRDTTPPNTWPDLRDPAFPAQTGFQLTYVWGYVEELYYLAGIMALAKYSNSPSDRAAARAFYDQFRSDFPESTIVTYGNPGASYAQIWNRTNMKMPDEVTSAWDP